MKPKARILVLVERFGQGGAEKMAAMLAGILQDSGRFEVWLCSVYRFDAVHFNDAGVAVLSLDIEKPGSLAQRILAYGRKLVRLRKLKAQLGIDLTISSLWPADWINALVGRDRKIAIIQINILNNVQNVAMVRFRSLVRLIYNRFDRVVLGSASLAEELTGYFRVREALLTVIPNSIDTRAIDRNVEEPLPPSIAELFDHYRVLVAANRLHETKNTRSLLPIFSNVPARRDLKLLIIGEGEEEESIKQDAIGNGLRWSRIGEPGFDPTADVYLLGFQKNIHNLIRRSKLFLFPTRAEGTPLALLEALYCGTPVLASDCPNGGVFEAMRGSGVYDRNHPRRLPERTDAGLLMPIPGPDRTGSIETWTRCISELLGGDAATLRAIGEGGRAVARAYDRAQIQSRWLATIAAVLPGA
jgi:glycosyltransferase involved in cell wall biosynthesis